MKKTRNILILFFCGLLLVNNLYSNNLQIEHVAYLSEQSVRFEISWDNSWNLSTAPYNHDAVWVFFKMRLSTGHWQHLNVSSAASDYFVASNQIEIETVTDAKGFFVRRAQNGSGNINSQEITIIFPEPFPDNASVFQVFGIEMVYIPEGAFYIGDTQSVNSFVEQAATPQPFYIDSEDAISVGEESGNLYITNLNAMFSPPLPETDIPSTFPKGYAGFYCMKYEITQQQYVDFLNCLTFEQQTARTAQPPNAESGTPAMLSDYLANAIVPDIPQDELDSISRRNGIVIQSSGSENFPAVYACNASHATPYNQWNDAQNRAMNWLNWADVAAYLDWAALRPLSETELEKICRGAENQPVNGQMAWATQQVVNALTPQYDGTVNETVAESGAGSNGIANYGTILSTQGWPLWGPLRSGFAATANSTRIESGAAYYGVFEMSGNVWEPVISIHATAFERTPGDGELDNNGYANVPTWPLTENVILRGGAWNSAIINNSSSNDLFISDRFYAHLFPENRLDTMGGRGGR